MLALAVTALHGLGAILELVAARATRADQGFRALVDVMTVATAVAAADRTSIRAVLAHVAFLLADATLASEHTRVGTVSLVVAAIPLVSWTLMPNCICLGIRRKENVPGLAAVEAGAIAAVAASIGTEATTVAGVIAEATARAKTTAVVGIIEVSGLTTATPVAAVVPRHDVAKDCLA